MTLITRVFLCKAGDGFNFTMSRSVGYEWVNEYLKGEVNQKDEPLSWSGKHVQCQSLNYKIGLFRQNKIFWFSKF